jgi:hypothetical protein
MRDIGVVADKSLVCEARNYRSPRINMARSGEVVLEGRDGVAVPVKYAKVKDRRGVSGDRLHGRAAAGGEPSGAGRGARQRRVRAHYGYLIKFAVERGCA